MAKFIERIIDSEGFPLENDLWLRWKNGNPTLLAFDGVDWKEIAGGGGSAEGSVSYNEQVLTDAQKTQARKNQGLYYTETVPEQLIAEWDGNTDGLIWFDEKDG